MFRSVHRYQQRYLMTYTFNPINSVEEVLVVAHVCRTRFYDDVREGNAETYKRGKRRFMTGESLQAYVDWLISTGESGDDLPPKKQRTAETSARNAEARASA